MLGELEEASPSPSLCGDVVAGGRPEQHPGIVFWGMDLYKMDNVSVHALTISSINCPEPKFCIHSGASDRSLCRCQVKSSQVNILQDGFIE